MVFGHDHAGEDLPLVENLEALFVEALLERELVFEFFRRLRRCDVGDTRPLYSCAGSPIVRSHPARCAVPR
jgi:hypothetical protein